MADCSVENGNVPIKGYIQNADMKSKYHTLLGYCCILKGYQIETQFLLGTRITSAASLVLLVYECRCLFLGRIVYDFCTLSLLAPPLAAFDLEDGYRLCGSIKTVTGKSLSQYSSKVWCANCNDSKNSHTTGTANTSVAVVILKNTML